MGEVARAQWLAMSERVIPLVDQRHPSLPLPTLLAGQDLSALPLDGLHRPLTDCLLYTSDAADE